jgi:hypothetical protein
MWNQFKEYITGRIVIYFTNKQFKKEGLGKLSKDEEKLLTIFK